MQPPSHTGQTQSLYVLTKYHNQRFEFIFTMEDSTDTLFSCVHGVFKAYDNSRLYRDLKLRGEQGPWTAALLPYREIVPGPACSCTTCPWIQLG